ncbi:MAG: hypothetical protein CFE26_22680, partial [Verrucomicrobiales bacterium VVV1]
MKSTTSLIAAAIAGVFAAGAVATHAAPLNVAAAAEEKEKEGCPAKGKDKDKEGCPAKKKEEKKEGTVLAE